MYVPSESTPWRLVHTFAKKKSIWLNIHIIQIKMYVNFEFYIA